MTDPNNPNYFGLPVIGWDATRFRVKDKIVFDPNTEINSQGPLTILASPIVLTGNDVCVTAPLLVDTIEGKENPNNINIAGIQITNSKIPDSAFQNQPLIFKQCWDASTNVPPLVSGIGENGDYYLVCVNGNTNLDGNTMWEVGDAAVFNGETSTWFKIGGVGAVSITLTSAGGAQTLVNQGVGPNLVVKGLTAGTGTALVPTSNDITIVNTSPASSVTLTNAGGINSLVGTSSGPGLTVKGLTAGAGITLTPSSTDITITNSSPASGASITSAGGTQTLVNTSAGPNMIIKGLTAGTGVTLTPTANDVTISNASPASSLSLGSAGGTQTLVNTGTGPGLVVKGLTAGAGISLTPSGNDITITNSAGASSVTLANAGTTSLVNQGTGPALQTKGLVAGSNISFTTSATDITINSISVTTTLASAGGTQTLVNQGTGPSLAIKGLTAGTGISLTPTANDITIASTGSAVTLSSAGGTQTLVNSGTGPSLATKGLTAGTGITLTPSGTDITIVNSSPASSVTLSNAGTTSLVNTGTGPSLATKGLVAGTGIGLSSNGTDVTISSTIVQGTVVYFCGNAANNGGVGYFGFLQTGGVAPGVISGYIGIAGTWYDPFSQWNSGSRLVGLSSSKKYICNWSMPIGTFTNTFPMPAVTGSFAAWSLCESASSPGSYSFGTISAFGGGGTGNAGTQINSSGTVAVNVPTSGATSVTTTLTDIGLKIYNDTGSTDNVDLGLHEYYPTGSTFGGRDLGCCWIIYQF